MIWANCRRCTRIAEVNEDDRICRECATFHMLPPPSSPEFLPVSLATRSELAMERIAAALEARSATSERHAIVRYLRDRKNSLCMNEHSSYLIDLLIGEVEVGAHDSGPVETASSGRSRAHMTTSDPGPEDAASRAPQSAEGSKRK